MAFIIREMNQEDIQSVQHVATVSWNSIYEGIIPLEVQERFLAYAYSREMLKKRVEKSVMLVTEVAGDVVGFANFSPLKEGGVTELLAIYLLPDYQRSGIGKALLEEGMKRIGHVKEVVVNVEKGNVIGTSFYQAQGFLVISEFDDNFDGHILKTVSMAWRTH